MGSQYGVQYFLRINVFNDSKWEWAEEVDAFFGEEGTIGMRDAAVMAKYEKKPPEDWMEDPYDKQYLKGIRMNKSENALYDSLFPNHPLSQARMFLRYIVENN